MDRLWEEFEAYLAVEQVELDDLRVAGKTLRVVVDATDGLDLDHIADVSRGLSRLLDDAPDLMPGSYNLEVTSPGLERKLHRPRHYEKSIGREVIVKTRDGRTIRGELSAAAADHFTVLADGDEVPVAFDDVASARTVFAFPVTSKPGKQKQSKSR